MLVVTSERFRFVVKLVLCSFVDAACTSLGYAVCQFTDKARRNGEFYLRGHDTVAVGALVLGTALTASRWELFGDAYWRSCEKHVQFLF